MKPCCDYDPFSGKHDAINNMGGLEYLYEKYLERFKIHHQATAMQLALFIETKNYDDAYILVHSIRGLSATLGMQTLSKQAEVLEGKLKEGSFEDLPSLVVAFQAALYLTVQPAQPQSSSSVGTGLSGI